MAATSTIQLLNTIEWAKKFMFNKSPALGNNLEPAMTSANTILQTIIGPPFAWRWNRISTGFVTTSGTQDYTLGNWAASTAVVLGFLIVDTNGNSQKVTTAGNTGSTQPTWNAALNGTTNDNAGGGTAVWTNLGPIGNGVSGFTFGWIENASVQDSSLSPVKWFEIQPKISLALDSSLGRPRFISAQKDDGQGNITFRLMTTPDAIYPINLNLQKKSILFTQTSQTWAPIPDEYSYIYNWGFLALMWLFADDSRFPIANQKFVATLLGANQGLTDTQINIFLTNWQAITGQPILNASRLAQGTQALGT